VNAIGALVERQAAHMVAGLALSGERGVGDTIYRLLTEIGAHQAVQQLSKALGMTCRCEGRRLRLNERYPYR